MKKRSALLLFALLLAMLVVWQTSNGKLPASSLLACDSCGGKG